MDFEKGNIIHGFEVLTYNKQDKLKAETVHLKHQTTGLEVFHVITDDSENFFAYAFSTPPYNDTGLPHILEHCCLAGSKNYPLKDPFQVMMQKSVNTFLNAMTYSDKTVYPASSVLEKDYFNLFKMYGDAVFFPLLRKETFQQEGWRFNLDKKNKPELKGIVFNEMKGVYSDIESILYEQSSSDLFVESAYRYNSGGNPFNIPELSYQEFLDYHKKYYATGNCRLFLYGNIPTEKQLDVLANTILKDLDKKSPAIYVADSTKITQPKKSHYTGPSVKGQKKNFLSINWALKNTIDSYETTKLALMSYVLLGNPGSILFKAILESDLCEDISDVSGIDTYKKDYIFSCGARGCKAGNEKKFEKFVLDTLKKVVKEGIPELNIEAALNKYEFSSFEIKSSVPVGFDFMNKILKTWLYGSLPDAALDYMNNFAKVREELKTNPRLFEDLIQQQLIDNEARTLIVVTPDSNYEKKLEKKLKSKTKTLFKKTNIEEVKKDNINLEKYQKEKDKDEDLLLIPAITKEDLPQKIRDLNFEEIEDETKKVFYSDLFTNSIFYSAASFDISALPKELLPYLPLFSRLIFDLSLEDKAYDQVSNEIAVKMGGLSASLDVSRPYNNLEARAKINLLVMMKTTDSLLPEALELLEDLVNKVNFRDFKRIKEVLVEVKNGVEINVASAATSLSIIRAGSVFSDTYAINEVLNGYSQYGFLVRLLKNFETLKEDLAEKMYTLLEFVFAGEKVFSFTGNRELKDLSKTKFDNIFDKFKRSEEVEAFSMDLNSFKTEGVIIPANVSFSALALPGAKLGTKEHASYKALATMMKTGILWDLVRNENGAYGVSAGTSGTEALFFLSSYRDPETLKTLAAYRKSLEYFAEEKFSKDDFESSIVSLLGTELRPLRPGAHNLSVLRFYNNRISDQLRQKDFDLIKNLEYEDIVKAAKSLLDNFEQAVAAFAAPARLLQEFNKKEIVIRDFTSF